MNASQTQKKICAMYGEDASLAFSEIKKHFGNNAENASYFLPFLMLSEI